MSSSIPFAVYDLATGRILHRGSVPAADVDLQAQEGQGLILTEEMISNSDFYVDLSGTPTPRPLEDFGTFDKLEIEADGVDVATLAGLPAGATVRINRGESVSVDDGSIEITAISPGPVKVQISMPLPYRNITVTIDAV